MTIIAVLGDSHSGKSAYAHAACNIAIPLNLFESKDVETYFWYGLNSSAEVRVIPGTASNKLLKSACIGADGIVVLYEQNKTVYCAKRWIVRLGHCLNGVQNIPILICKHKSNTVRHRHDRRLTELLQRFPLAEHTCTTISNITGIQDSLNRIITHARKQIPSPLSEHIRLT